MHWGISSFDGMRGRRLLPVAVVLGLLAAALAAGALAQRVVPETPRINPVPTIVPPSGGSSGVGGGAGLIPTMPQMRSAPAIAPAPQVAPAAPARAIRFRCDLEPQAEACKEPGAPDGGGDDSECNCARDHCYTAPAGNRVCEKLQ